MHKLSMLALVAVLRSQFLFQGKSCFGYATVPVLKQPLLLTTQRSRDAAGYCAVRQEIYPTSNPTVIHAPPSPRFPHILTPLTANVLDTVVMVPQLG